MNWFKLVPIIIAWVPHVVRGVVTIEALFANGKTGEEKREAVLLYLSETSERLGLPWGEQAIEVVDSIIETVVRFLNLFKVFTKGDQPALPEVQALARTMPEVNVKEVIHQSDPALEAFLARTN